MSDSNGPEKRWRPFEMQWSGAAGMTLLELMIAVGLFAIVAVVGNTALRSLRGAHTSQSVRAQLQDEVTFLQGHLRKVFVARANFQLTPSGNGLIVERYGAGMNYGTLHTTRFQTTCLPLPANHMLTPTEQTKLAALASCAPCSAGYRPVITITDTELASNRNVPAVSNTGITLRPVGGALCATSHPTGVSLAINMALISEADDGKRTIVTIDHQQMLGTQRAASKMQILH